jgi:SAM-dependent methyltransferase
MTSSIGKASRILLWLSFAIGSACFAAQVAAPERGHPDAVKVAKLCMPVSYRQVPSIQTATTRIPMLGDRYGEVQEAVSGWKESRVPLVGRFDRQWEAVPCGDDTGIFYLVPLLARTTGWSVDRSLDVFLFGVLAISAIIGLAGLWFTASGVLEKAIAIVPLCIGTWLSYKAGDVYVVQGSVVLMSIPWLVSGLSGALKPRRSFPIVFLSGVALGFAQWIRTQSAVPALVFFLVLLGFSRVPRSLKLGLILALLVGMSLPLFYARSVLHRRDSFLAAHQPGFRPPLNHHLFWHTAYLGLGYLTNPFVEGWHDSLAVEYVQTIDPAAIYGGEEYDSLLRAHVKELVRRHPRFVLDTVAAKSGVLAMMLLLAINLGFPAAISRPKPTATEAAFWLAMATGAAPGILAVPATQYVLGMITFALLYWYYSVSLYLKSGAVNEEKQLRMGALLASYPRSRPELPSGQRASYVEHYRSNREAKQGLAKTVGKLESWMHRRVAEKITEGTLLEVGAGNLNHVPYLPAACVCDAVEPFQELWEDSPFRSRIRNLYADLEQVPLTGSYDCIFSVAVLEHLNDLPATLARCGLLLREGGSFRAGFPTEGGLLWGLAWRFTTGIEYRIQRGLDYGAIMRHEHLNTAEEILALLYHFYERVEVSRFPLPLRQLSFYTAITAYDPRRERCRQFGILDRQAISIPE